MGPRLRVANGDIGPEIAGDARDLSKILPAERHVEYVAKILPESSRERSCPVVPVLVTQGGDPNDRVTGRHGFVCVPPGQNEDVVAAPQLRYDAEGARRMAAPVTEDAI
jgi:hypothetical protein